MYPTIDIIKQLLLKENYITEEESEQAEARSEDSESYLQQLISAELLTKDLIGRAIAEWYKAPYVDLTTSMPAAEDIKRIPEQVSRENRAIYIRSNEKLVAIATDNPAELKVDVFKKIFKNKSFKVAYALPEDIDLALQEYRQTLEARFNDIIASGNSVAPQLLQEIIADALNYRASDIHMEPLASGTVNVRFRIDGSLSQAGVLPHELYENVLNRIKVEGGMRIDERFSAQDGSLQYANETLSADLRVSLVPTVTGEKVVMRVLASHTQGFSLKGLGLSDAHMKLLEATAKKPFGMILTTGPTGSGKTTSLYALLKLLNRPDINIMTIEDPAEYRVEGINQIQVRNSSNLTFASGLRAIVRQDPDIILVGEIRDHETAEISVNAALTGHLLLSTFHANDAATSIPRLIEMGVEPFLLASTLELVIAQRLVRKICTHCRHTISADEALSSVGSPAELKHYVDKRKTFYMGSGCTHCSGTGYHGRVALYELIPVDIALQDLIAKNPSRAQINELVRSSGHMTMFDDGIEKAENGQTTISEVLRVVELTPKGKKAHGK